MKPIAWIAVGDNTSVFFDLDCALAIDENPTPLYTHPADLTDEEIVKEWAKFYPDVFHTHLIDFARAILRKAQEK
jgi:hypothetical protein